MSEGVVLSGSWPQGSKVEIGDYLVFYETHRNSGQTVDMGKIVNIEFVSEREVVNGDVAAQMGCLFGWLGLILGALTAKVKETVFTIELDDGRRAMIASTYEGYVTLKSKVFNKELRKEIPSPKSAPVVKSVPAPQNLEAKDLIAHDKDQGTFSFKGHGAVFQEKDGEWVFMGQTPKKIGGAPKTLPLPDGDQQVRYKFRASSGGEHILTLPQMLPVDQKTEDPAPVRAAESSKSNRSGVEDLVRLNELRTSGAISEEEYQSIKGKIINSM